MNNIFNLVFDELTSQKLYISDKDVERPWGGFFSIDEKDSEIFLDFYFNGNYRKKIPSENKISLKILVIAPNKKLSWQYHKRRSEIWKVYKGSIKVVRSHDNIQRKEIFLNEGDEIKLFKGERHRIIGTNDFAIVAEVWIHTDKNDLSNEDDIVRVEDDFGR